MADLCQVIPADGVFAQRVIGFLDCQARTLGADGYAALAAPGSSASLLLSTFLTLFVALFGLRLLLGHTPDIRDGLLAAIKIGAVLALATGWPAYQTLVYDVVLSGPSELVSQIGAPTGLPGSTGGLVGRLDGVDGGFRQLAILDVGTPPPSGDAAGSLVRYPPALFRGFDTFAIGTARSLFMASAIGAFAFVRLGAGMLLALGPLFICFLLFDATRSLFEGWLRALLVTLLGSIATAIALGVELALLEPWLSDLVARRAATIAIPGAPNQLLAITLVFAIVIAALLRLMGKLAFSLPIPLRVLWRPFAAPAVSALQERSILAQSSHSLDLEARTRAASVSAAISATQRREVLETQALTQSASTMSRAQLITSASREQPTAPIPLGSTFRRTASRVSGSATKRDA